MTAGPAQGGGMEAVLLAGGRGTRLASVLADRPKPMAEIAGRPFLEYVMDALLAQGFARAVLSVGYQAETIEQHFGGRYRGLELAYAVEETALGTGGGIRQALRLARAADVFVLNGDTYLEMEYAPMLERHKARGAACTVALRRVEDVSRYGAVRMDAEGRIVGFGEKSEAGPGLINAGTYLLRRELLEGMALPERFSMESDVLMARLGELRPLGHVVEGYFIDIGVPEELDRARRELPLRKSLRED